MEWNDATITRLVKLWDEGMPVADIGREIGCTKAAVSGKAHRLHLPARPSPIKRSPDGLKAEGQAVKPMRLPKKAGFSSLAIVDGPACVGVPMGSLAGKCCWPMGSPKDPHFKYCDAPAPVSRSYCLLHRHVSAHGWDETAHNLLNEQQCQEAA